jgi:hypothetical protein
MQAHSSYAAAVTELTSEASNKLSNVIPFENQELVNGYLHDSNNDAVNMLFMLHGMLIGTLLEWYWDFAIARAPW